MPHLKRQEIRPYTGVMKPIIIPYMFIYFHDFAGNFWTNPGFSKPTGLSKRQGDGWRIFAGALTCCGNLSTYPYEKSLYKSYIVGMGYNPQESLENTINTMGTRTLGVFQSLSREQEVTTGSTKNDGSMGHK